MDHADHEHGAETRKIPVKNANSTGPDTVKVSHTPAKVPKYGKNMGEGGG